MDETCVPVARRPRDTPRAPTKSHPKLPKPASTWREHALHLLPVVLIVFVVWLTERNQERTMVVTHKVFLDIAAESSEAAGRVVIGLFGKEAPTLANKFRGLAREGYKGSRFDSAGKGNTIHVTILQ